MLSRDSADGRQRAFERAEKLTEEGDHEHAAPIWEWLVSSNQCGPGDGLQGRLAACYRRLCRKRELEALLDRLVAAGRPHVQVVLQVALARAEWGALEEALALLDSARSGYGPDQQAEILRVRATLLTDAGRHDQAMDFARGIAGLGTRKAHREAAFALALAELKYRRAILEQSDPDTKLNAYWEERRDFVYVHVCRQLIELLGASAGAVADIGSNRTPILDFFADSPRKYSVDPASPYESTDVHAVREDFLSWTPPEHIHVGTCLQVLEHIREVDRFASRLLELCEVVLISVPFREKAGVNPDHIHSEIDLDRIIGWFGRAPNFHYIARELAGEQRIICVFDTTTEQKWATLGRNELHGLQFRYRWSMDAKAVQPTGGHGEQACRSDMQRS